MFPQAAGKPARQSKTSRSRRSSAMAGHSKWKQIKRKKAVTDSRRA
jgi:hypothetical protein